MARSKSNGSSKVSTATIGFEATAVRDSAISKSEATLRSRSAVEPQRSEDIGFDEI